jgi:hypothetical protein
MKFLCVLFAIALQILPLRASSGDAASMQKKLQYIQSNGASSHPSQSPTEFTEQEINSYLASDLVALPAGIQSLHVSGESGALTATARIDFDQVKIGRHSSNPLLLMFNGTHDVQVAAHAHGAGHQGFVHVDSVQLDGVEIPDIVLQLFVEKYLQPKYPNIGIDSRFPLPDRIDTATIGTHKLILTQK